jgi:acyl-CoA thioester hydrolase
LPESFPAACFPVATAIRRVCKRLKVAWRDLDPVQHVNNAIYLVYAEECGMQVIAAHRWPLTRMLKEGFAILLRRNQVQYLHPAVLGDELSISTWASDVKRSTATRYYTIRRGRWTGAGQRTCPWGVGRFIHRKADAHPARLREDFAPNIVYPDQHGIL